MVDFIGVDAYYTLVPDKSNTTVNALVAGWKVIVNSGMRRERRGEEETGGERRRGRGRVINSVIGTGGMNGGLIQLTKKFNKTLAFTETGVCSGGCVGSTVVNQDMMVTYLLSFIFSFSCLFIFVYLYYF